MRIAGEYLLDAPVERIWPAIFDPVALMGLIPGCEQIEQISPDEYRGRLRIGIAAVAGTYETYVRVLDRREPTACRMKGEVSGPTGSISGEASFNLKEVDSQTILTYEGEAVIGGALGQISCRFFEGVANTFIQHGLGKLNKQLQAGAPTSPGAD